MTNPDAKLLGLFGVTDGADIYNITMRIMIYELREGVYRKTVAPILALGLGDTRFYDNQIYPKK